MFTTYRLDFSKPKVEIKAPIQAILRNREQAESEYRQAGNNVFL